MADDKRAKRPGLSSKGNRVLLAIASGWVLSYFARLLGAETIASYALMAITAAIAYAITTAAVQR